MTKISRRQLMTAAGIGLLTLVVGGMLDLAPSTPASAASSGAINADDSGLALYGYDPVAYFDGGEPRPGDASITADHDGATYRFATPAHRDAFVKEPARYLPAYGGYCAYGVAKGYKVKVDPTVWSIVDGKLYLNYNAPTGALWSKDIPGYIGTADKNWSTVKDRPRSE